MKLPRTLSRIAATCLAFIASLVLQSRAAADAVLHWNKTMCDFSAGLGANGLPPFLEVRVYAMAHLAMLDALRSVSNPPASSRSPQVANADAAIAAAAYGVLKTELPMGDAFFDAAYSAALAGIPLSGARSRGLAIGEAAANEILAKRANDDPFGRLLAPYTPGTGPGAYQPTPPINFVAGAGWATMPAFVLKSNDQFRPPPPYTSLRSFEYTMDVNEIQVLGKAGSTARTTEQTQVALFWYENSSFAWNRIAQTVSIARQLSLNENARLFAALNCGIVDAYIASMDSKFHYNFWRPITAIRAAGIDGNALTVPDVAWEPLNVTPPVPDYTSAHAAAGGAASVIIAAWVGDTSAFSSTSTTAPGTRMFERLSDAAVENAYSRMLVGIHFRRACTAGLEQGRSVGTYILKHAKFLKP